MPTSLAVKPGKTTIEFPQVRNLFQELEGLTDKLAKRAFGLFRERGSFDGRDLDDWFQAESELLKAVPIEISEPIDSYTIRAEVPGFAAKDLTIQAEPNSIYIHGKMSGRKKKTGGPGSNCSIPHLPDGLGCS